MLIREVMSHPVITVRSWTPTGEAAHILQSRGFTSLPVLDDDDVLVGVVSEGDLLRWPLTPDPRRHPHFFDRSEGQVDVVAEVMTPVVESLTPGADVADAARMMVDEHIRALPVVDGTTVVGMITRRDLLRSEFGRTDEALSRDVIAVLGTFDDPDRWTVSVQAAVADIGDVRDVANDRERAHRLVAAIPGIVHVDVNHVTPDPS